MGIPNQYEPTWDIQVRGVEREGIRKGSNRLLKGDSMLAKIIPRFCCIPLEVAITLEGHACHRITCRCLGKRYRKEGEHGMCALWM